MATVTIFKNAKTPFDPQYMDHQEVIFGIRDGKWKEQIEKLNSFEYDNEAQKEYKRHNLPGIVWQGEFDYRDGTDITKHAGMVAIDIDHLPESEMKKYRELITKNKYTHALFLSPRRDGLKVIIRIPPDIENHKEYVAAIGEQYKKHAHKYYDHFDDIARLCFVSYDPNIYYNPNSEVYTQRSAIKKFTPSDADISKVADDAKYSFNRIRVWADKTSSYSDGNKHKHLIKIFTACNRAGVPKDDAVKMTYNRYGDTKGVEPVSFSDYEHRADSVYRLYPSEFGTRAFNDTPEEQPQPQPQPQPEPSAPITPPSTSGFPVEVFPAKLQRLINELNATMNYSKDFSAAAAMFTLATINGNKFKLNVKREWKAPSVFWFAIVGEPGTMKTHPIRTMISPLVAIDKMNKRAYDLDVIEWEEEKKANGNKPTRPFPKFRQIIISDITIESLHDVHTHNKRGLGYYKDELIGFLKNMNQYRPGGDEEFWLESFNNGDYNVNRVTKKPTMINNVMVNIIGTIQPNTLTALTKDHSTNGLTDRFLYTSAETNIYPMSLEDIDQALIDDWRSTMIDVNKTFEYFDERDTVYINMTLEAKKLMKEIDQQTVNVQNSEGTTASMKTYLNKSKTYMPRFALLMALFDLVYDGMELIVTEDHVHRAWRVMQYYINSASDIFNQSEQILEIRRVAESLRGMTKTEMINELSKKGFKNTDIASYLKVTRQFVSKVLSKK